MLELIDAGWVPYGHAPFAENLDAIIRLIGSMLYETLTRDGMCYVRRVED